MAVSVDVTVELLLSSMVPDGADLEALLVCDSVIVNVSEPESDEVRSDESEGDCSVVGDGETDRDSVKPAGSWYHVKVFVLLPLDLDFVDEAVRESELLPL